MAQQVEDALSKIGALVKVVAASQQMRVISGHSVALGRIEAVEEFSDIFHCRGILRNLRRQREAPAHPDHPARKKHWHIRHVFIIKQSVKGEISFRTLGEELSSAAFLCAGQPTAGAPMAR